MDFAEAKKSVLDYCGQASGGEFEKAVGLGINQTYRQVLDSGNVPHEHRVFSFTSVADTAEYGMPLYVRKIVNIEDPTTPRFVYNTTARHYDKAHAGSTATGTPFEAFSIGTRGVEKFPSTDSVLTIVSDATEDSGDNFKVRVTGFNTSGVLVTELKPLSGLTPVTTSNTYDSTLGVERIVKTATRGNTFTGNLTVKDAAANVLAVIPTWWDSPDYNWVRLHTIPSSAITYNVRAEMRKPPLVNDEDWPEFDQEFHDLLIWGTTKDLLPTIGKSGTADRHRETFEQRMLDFAAEKNYRPAAIHVFADVQSYVGAQNRPGRPQIAGVDFGLASN